LKLLSPTCSALFAYLPSVASKRGHETKKRVLLGCQTVNRLIEQNKWEKVASIQFCLISSIF